MRLIFLWLLLASASVSAADWRVQPGSTLGFAGSFQGEAFSGRFARFTPLIRFDPSKPLTGRFDVSIDLASANTRNDERDEMLRGSDFFHVSRQPTARFLATRFRALGGRRYAADGVLSLNGISKPVTLMFRWTPGARAVLDGEATLKRLDFGVGRGEWTDTELLPNTVRVTTHLVLAPAK